MTIVRRGLRKISALDAASDLAGAIQEIEGLDGMSYQTPASSALMYTVLEERPPVPSPYDDEFDTTILDAKWTQTAGASTDYEIRNSRLQSMTAQQCLFVQAHALTNPLRVMFGFCGQPNAAYVAAGINLQGATKGLRFAVDGGGTNNARRLAVQRLSAAGVYEADLQVGDMASSYGIAGSATHQQLTLIIDATNVLCYCGELGSPRLIYTYARTNLGTLNAFRFEVNRFAAKWFRVDRATLAIHFPLDWAG